MANYINLEAAVDAVTNVYYNTPDINLSADKLEASLRRIPAADVAPVAHGRWIYHDDDGVVTCSECGNAESSEGRYCSYCGARMDEEER